MFQSIGIIMIKGMNYDGDKASTRNALINSLDMLGMVINRSDLSTGNRLNEGRGADAKRNGTAAHTAATSPRVGRKGYPPNRYPISVDRATQRDTAQACAKQDLTTTEQEESK